MNPTTAASFWEICQLTIFHSTWMALLAFAATRWMRNVYLQRTVWRTCIVCTLLMLACLIAGLDRWDWSGASASRTLPDSKSMFRTNPSLQILLSTRAESTEASDFNQVNAPTASSQPHTAGLSHPMPWGWALGSMLVALGMGLNAW